ncbi:MULTISPECIES: U32 family peptidase [unclassified Emergencia]|uniref:U32 family peptidase n=1 Tax=unclassified Emergencia TaxID=2642996 RepID=UPI00137AE227|nr:U32 family peptidase [Emergencia sp. 1XD21-10]NCE98451.1 U32 family peptidase [Emergencia sp. 1XD21-10]
MTELLAPAGNMEALKAAIANGCDAVYLGMRKFGARAYSSNFDTELLKEAVAYAHLRNVKIYVTMNTIVFEDEIDDMKKQLQLLNEIGVDGVIVQDLAVFDYAVNHFEDMEVHCSTQMGIDDLEGTLLFKELGAKRVVLSREVEIEKVKEIKRTAKIPLEIFVHGALCVSYSGNCLMSGLIGYRSGNRGRCVGSCRKPYELIDRTTGESFGKNYLLSTKDLNTIDYIEELKEIDSLKIEGRMKEPAYVANVVSKYRAALDGKVTVSDKEDLKKTFNRTFTKGYLFHEDPKDLSNIQRPNNFGYEIGRITGFYKGMYEITLDKVLNQNDIIRIDAGGEDVNLSVVKLYDREGMLINKAEDVCYIKIKEKLSIGDVIYKTKDYLFYNELGNGLQDEFRRFPLHMKVYAYPGANLVIDAEGLGCSYLYESGEILEEAMNNPTTREQVVKQLSKLKDTVFSLGDVEFEEYNAFIPVKMLNSARRTIVQALYDAKITGKARRTKIPEAKKKISFAQKNPYLTVSVTTKAQYDACVKCGIKEIYFDNVIRRNQITYEEKEGELLIGGYGGIYYYRDRNPFVTDYSLNVVNADSCYELFRLGAKRVTLSYELNKKQIGDLIDAYYAKNDGYPALEMVVYGRAPLMFTKYCPMKKMNQCGNCRAKTYEMKDEYGTFPILSHGDCTTTILNGKILNLLDEIPSIRGIEAFRLNFTIESKDEVVKVVKAAQQKLNSANATANKPLFNQETDTRGHFNKEII